MKTIKWCGLDFNWVRSAADRKSIRMGLPHELAGADPRAFVDWHLDLGCNLIIQHAYTFNGCAWYPTRLGPCMPEPDNRFLEQVMQQAQAAGAGFGTYFNVGVDAFICAARKSWLVPGSWEDGGQGFLAPESEWTDLLCRRVEEVVKRYPLEVILFDWFTYGTPKDRLYPVQPAAFVRQPFKEIIGRAMPEQAEEITAEESLRYQREVLARQFRRIRDTVKSIRSDCALMFNCPFWKADDPKWAGHPMVAESDWLFAECSRPEVVDWLLFVRKPGQRVFTTVIGAPPELGSDPADWKHWHDRGCDLAGYVFPEPFSHRPGPWYDAELAIIREAFRSI